MPGASDDNALIVPCPTASVRPQHALPFEKIVADIEMSVAAAAAVDAVRDFLDVRSSNDDIGGVRDGDSPGARANRHVFEVNMGAGDVDTVFFTGRVNGRCFAIAALDDNGINLGP